MTEAVVVYQANKAELEISDIIAQVQKIQGVMQAVMKVNEHYGIIPGTGGKPTLLKPGAEKLCLTFRLDPQYEVVQPTEEKDFIAYTVKCTLYHIPSGQRIASGVGACNSREKKYAFKRGEPVANPWENQNTLMKMAAKRALVAAVLNGTAASDIFTQDLEDMDVGQVQHQDMRKPQQAQEPTVTDEIESLFLPDGTEVSYITKLSRANKKYHQMTSERCMLHDEAWFSWDLKTWSHGKKEDQTFHVLGE